MNCEDDDNCLGEKLEKVIHILLYSSVHCFLLDRWLDIKFSKSDWIIW